MSRGCADYRRLDRALRARVSRRRFLVRGGIALATLGVIPGWLTRAAAAAVAAGRAGSRRKPLVVVFQRGAMDGLNAVIPYAEPSYAADRPSIGIPVKAGKGAKDGATVLDDRFALHPALAPLLPWYKQRALGIVHAAGLPFSTRSHFDAQDYMETGTPDTRGTTDGWLNRHLAASAPAEASPLRAVSLTSSTPRTMRGDARVLAVDNLRALRSGGPDPAGLATSFESLYAATADAFLHGAGRELFDAEKTITALQPEAYQPARGVVYPKGRLGDDLKQIALLIKAGVGLEAGFVEVGGWDHHANEGGVQGQLAYRLAELGGALAAFAADLGSRLDDVAVVTMSEFGRTIKENGNRGTDHGYGNVMFALGGRVRGGRIHGAWPGLAPGQRFEGRDLAVTTDYRTVLAEALRRHLGAPDTAATFPGFTPPRLGLFA